MMTLGRDSISEAALFRLAQTANLSRHRGLPQVVPGRLFFADTGRRSLAHLGGLGEGDGMLNACPGQALPCFS